MTDLYRQAAVKLTGLVLLVTVLCLLLRTVWYQPTVRKLQRVHHYSWLPGSRTSGNESSSYVPLEVAELHTFPQTMPHGVAVRPVDTLQNAPWVNTLRSYVQYNLVSYQITVVTADWNFLPNLLNWLVSAVFRGQLSVKNVIILALDEEVHSLLQRKGFFSVYISRESVIRPETKMQSNWSHIWIIRCTVFRILNHWGFDVATYDVDAIPLKNLQPKFEEHLESDLVGSYGIYPFPLHKKWGVTFCMGVALFRSTKFTELLWDSLSTATSEHYDDQVKLNTALDHCGITWTHRREDGAYHGRCQSTGLRVSVLPPDMVCRSCKHEKVDRYYVWHQRGSRKSSSKVEKALEGGAWLLRDDWEDKLLSYVNGTNWLRQIATHL